MDASATPMIFYCFILLFKHKTVSLRHETHKQKKKMDEKMVNQPCYDKDGNFIGWFSRSIAVAVIVLCNDSDGNVRVLGAERGPEAADFRGCYNLPCGYLDFNETLEQAARREILEEVGLDLSDCELDLIGVQDDPVKSNRQNVTMRYVTTIYDKKCEKIEFSRDGNEGAEVGDIRWFKYEDIDSVKWAFGHDELAKEILGV